MRLAIVVFIMCFTLFCSAQHYVPIIKKGEIVFSIRNFGLEVKGQFTEIKGDIIFDSNHVEGSSFTISLYASGIETGIELRDKHLKKEEYLDVIHYPTIQFRSTAVSKIQNENRYLMRGNLTIKNVTRQIEFPFSVIKNREWIFTGQLKINRRDFSVGGKSLSMSDWVTIDLTVLALNQ